MTPAASLQGERIRLQPARVALAAEVGAGEADAFFFGKTDDLDIERQLHASRVEFMERDRRQ